MVSFWLDSWLEDKLLCVLYPILFDLCLNPKSSVYEMKKNEWVVPFRIILPPIVKDQWYELAGKLNSVILEGVRIFLFGTGRPVGSSLLSLYT
jgi:hypothetical protein